MPDTLFLGSRANSLIPGASLYIIFLVQKIFLVVLSLVYLAQGQEVKVFFHGGSEAETAALAQVISEFNRSQRRYEASFITIPQGDYLEQVIVAGVSGELPCLLDLDGPTLYNLIWSGFLQPIDDLIPEATKADMLPSIIQQGTYEGQLYSLGFFDSGLAIWGNKRLLEQAGVRIPTNIMSAWTLEEFNEALAALKALPTVDYAIDFQISNGEGEWFTYAFSPIVQSFGGDLIERETYTSAAGVLNGPEAVAAMTWFQSLFKDALATTTPTDDNDFVNGKVALSWGGHWLYSQYQQVLGDDLVLIPMPKLGEQAVTGMGSWNWGITQACDNVEGAAALLNFMLEPDHVRAVANANRALPSRLSVLRTEELFSEGGPLNIYVQQLKGGIAVPRPETAGYPAITEAFASAITQIVSGADVQTTLDEAAATIDQAMIDNNRYR